MDFRTELGALIDALQADGIEPVFLIVDLEGISYMKRQHGAETLEKFRAAAIDAISNAASGCDAFTYGDERIVAVLPGLARLKTFALIDKLRRTLPFLGQSFDCVLRPEFDVLEYDPARGVGGLISELSRLSRERGEDTRSA
jgi:hypothetical protein